MANLAKYIVKLEAQTAKYQRKLDQAEKKLTRFDRKNRRSMDGLKKAFIRLAGVVSVGLFARHIKSTISAIDEMGKLVDRLGGTTEAFSELELVAKLSGVAFRTLTIGMQRMARRVAEAAQGTGEAKDAIKELGLEAKNLATLSIDKQFEVIADRLHNVGSEADRLRLAFKLFDSEGVALLQTMTNGARGIQLMRLEARELGLSLSGQSVAAARDANDAMTRLSSTFKAMSQNLAILLTPAIEAMSNALRDFLTLDIPEEIASLKKELDVLQRARKVIRSETGSKNLELEIAGTAFAIELLETKLKKIERLKDPLQLIDITGNLARARIRIDEYNKALGHAREAMRLFREDRSLRLRFDAARESITSASKALDDFFTEQEDAADNASRAAEQLGLTFTSAFEDAVLEGKKLRDVLKGILKDILRIVLRKTVTERLASSITKLLTPSGGGGSSGSSSGGADAARVLTSLFPGREHGGGVTAGRGFVVGEDGPEFFQPKTSGTIIANGAGGASIVYNIDARGADADRILALLPPLLRETSDQTIARMYDLRAQGDF